jgi:hypothetical protein
MKEKLPIILMFVVVAAVGFGIFYVVTHYINTPNESEDISTTEETSNIPKSAQLSFDDRISKASSDGYTDPNKRYWINAPVKWQLVDKDLVMKAGEEALPSNLKDWVKPQNVDVMFMDLSTPGQFGSNLNIISLDPSYGLVIDNTTFPQLKSQILEQYGNMNLTDFQLLNSEIKDVAERNCAYFELTFSLLGNDIRTVQVIIPGSTAATILTYTMNAKLYDDTLKKKVEDSYNSYFSNSEKGF